MVVPERVSSLMPNFARLCTTIELWVLTSGPVTTIARLKEIRVCIYRHLAGTPQTNGLGIRVTKDGLPTILGDLIPLIRAGDKPVIRSILTFLLISRVIEGNKEPDIKDIITKSDIDESVVSEFTRLLPKLFRRLGLPMLVDLPEGKLHVSGSKGPNGLAVWCSLIDWNIINKDYPQLKDDLFMINPKLKDLFHSVNPDIATSWEQKWPSKYNVLRRLTVIKDVDAKSRVVAIGDWWTQSALKPLNDMLLHILKGIKEDCTFGQSIAPFGSREQDYHSIDLKSATDRFPVVITTKVISLLIGSEAGNAWERLMIETPFMDWSGNKDIIYGTGQPMGMLSSWASFALTHHLVVQWAAIRSGYTRKFRAYRLLGDDILIRDNQVASEYLHLLSQLKVEVSQAKTQVSKDSFEFAKRFFYNEEEVTGFPINGIQETHSNWSELLGVLKEGVRRGYQDISLDWVLSSRLFMSLGKPRGFAKRLTRNMLTSSWLWSGATDDIVLDKAQTLWGISMSCNTSIKIKKEYFMTFLGISTYDQILETQKSQVQEINSFTSSFNERLSGYFDPSEVRALPIYQVMDENRRDLSSALEEIRGFLRQGLWDKLIGYKFVASLNPQILDPSLQRRAKRRSSGRSVYGAIKFFRDALDKIRSELASD